MIWDRTLRREPAPPGTYTIVVETATSLGPSGLQAAITLGPPLEP